MAFTVGNQKENLFSKLKNMMPAKRIDMFRSSQARGGASPFSMLTPTEFAELFPRYYLKQKPDVRGFFDALSTRKRQGGEAGATSDSSPTANVQTGEKVTNIVKAKEIYDYIRSKGVDHVHALGIINNMKYESGFDSGILGDNRTSGGLFQHHASRFTAMKNYVGDDWKTNWKNQIDFAMTEREMKTYLGRNLSNARDASMRFTEDFEIPANTKQTAAYRASTADGYASAMEGRGGEPAGGQTPGGNYTLSTSGSVVPRDRSLYDSGNEEQCATLSKGFNPDIGRSSTWTVVPGQIKPGVVVATMRYNLPGGDRTGSGYHTGVALSAPDEKGKFLLLDQSNGNAPKVRTVNANSYSGGSMGGQTSFGLISSGGRLHDEQSLEALKFAADRAGDDETRKKIMSNYEAVTKGAERGPETGGAAVTVNENPNAEGIPGPQSNLQQQEAVKSIQTASVGDVFRMVGDMAGFFNRGEGLGGKGGRGRGRKSHEHGHHSVAQAQAPREKMQPMDMEKLLAIIRKKETESFEGNYSADLSTRELKPGQKKMTASGAYQYTNGTWKDVLENELGMKDVHDKYPRAVNAPKVVQDQVTATRFQKWRDSGRSDREILLHHFTGNFAGKLEKGAQKGNPTPEKYLAQSNKFALEYDKSYKPTQVASAPEAPLQTARKEMGPPIPETQTATVKPVSRFQELYDNARMYLDKARGGLYGELYGESFARNKPKAEPTPAPSVMDKTPTQNSPPGVYSGPEELDKNMMTPEPMTKDKQSFTKDKQSFNMNQIPSERQQTPTVIDKFMERKSAEFSSPSLERHAFTIRQQQPTIGANYMHMGTDTA